MHLCRFLIWTDAVAGPVPPTLLFSSDPVGSVLLSYLDYQPRKANTKSTITCQLALEIALRPGDIVSLYLDAFHSPVPQRQNFTVNSNPAAAFDLIWGVSATKMTVINLRVGSGRSINRTQMIELIFPSSCGIHTPVNGTSENSVLSTIAVQSISGSVNHRSIMISPAIGAFIHTSLQFFPRKADTETDLQLEVLPAMHLERSDSIVVQLPQFNGHSCKSAVESWPSVAHAAIWKLETHELSFIMSNRSDAGKKLVLNFRKTKTCSVRIPVDGISNKIEEQREFVISTNASNGAVLKDPVDLQTQIMYVQPVFALRKSVLSFIPSVAGSETTVKFEFQAYMNLSSGATLSIWLPTFRAKSEFVSVTNIISSPSGFFSKAEWISTSAEKKLVLTTKKSIQRNTKVIVWIPKSSGLTLPVQGVDARENISVSISDLSGSMLATVIQMIAIVPMFAKHKPGANGLFIRRPRLTFDMASGGAASSMVLAGELRWNVRHEKISRYKNIQVHIELPGFTGPEYLVFALESSGGKTSLNDTYGNWSYSTTCFPFCKEGLFAEETEAHNSTVNSTNDSQGSDLLGNASCPLLFNRPGTSCESKCKTSAWLQLTFPSFASVAKEKNMTIRIPSAFIRLPKQGIESGSYSWWANFSTSVDSVRTPLISVSLNVLPVGFVRSQPIMDFYPKRPDSEITITFSFSLAFELTEFDMIEFDLPNFSGDSFQDLEAESFPSSLFRASWENLSRKITFTLLQDQKIEACSKMILIVPSNAGVRLPRTAIEANSSMYRMHVRSRNGFLDSQTIISPSLGSFQGQLSFWAEQRSPSARTSLNFTFSPEMAVAVGEMVSINLPKFYRNGSYDCFPVLSNPLGFIALANWSAEEGTLFFRVERELKPFQVIALRVQSHSGIILPYNGLRANDSRLSISSNAASGPVDSMPLEEVPGIGYFLHSELLFSPPQFRNHGVEIKLIFAAANLLSLNDTVSLYLRRFTSQNNATKVSFSVSSSGTYMHPISRYGQPTSTSLLPSNLSCVPCVSSMFFDRMDIANGYYSSVCGLGGFKLRQEMHNLLLSTHNNFDIGTKIRQTINELDGRSSGWETNLKLLYSDELLIRNASFEDDESLWSLSFTWPEALGVGYEQLVCDNSSCTSASPRSDLHHQFAADTRLARLRANPLLYSSGPDQDTFKTSMLYSDCDASCQEDVLSGGVRYSSDWSPFAELFEPPIHTKGDIARALFYMALRYDGDDGLTDLELKDFEQHEDPECCFKTDTLKGCVSPVCYMGQLSTLLRWHIEDPPSKDERERNDKIQGLQGTRNPFVDFPQLTWLLYDTNGSIETLSDCGRDNSSFVHGTWAPRESKITLTVNRRIAPEQMVTVVIPSSLGLRLPEEGLFSRNGKWNDPYYPSGSHSMVPELSVEASHFPIMKTPILRSQAFGFFSTQPTLSFDEGVFPGAMTSLNFTVTLTIDLVPEDMLALQLPGFTFASKDVKGVPVSLVTGYAQNCSQLCDITCTGEENAGDINDIHFTPVPSVNNTNTTCSAKCEDRCSQTPVISSTFSGLIISEVAGLAVIIKVSADDNLDIVKSKNVSWSAGRQINFLVASQNGIRLPHFGVPARSHNMTLNITRTSCSRIPAGEVGACLGKTLFYSLGSNQGTSGESIESSYTLDSSNSQILHQDNPSFPPTMTSVEVQSGGVGSFQSVSIDYVPLIPGEKIDLILKLSTSTLWKSGDQIVLKFPKDASFGIDARDGSYYDTNTIIFTVLHFSYPIYAIWSKRCPEDTLILMLLDNNSGSEPAGDMLMSELTVLLPVQLGIILPYANILPNLPTFTLSAQLDDGSVSSEGSVVKSPGVVMMNWRTTQVSFSKQRAGVKTGIYFRFTTSLPLEPGNEIVLRMPGFVGREIDCFAPAESFDNSLNSAAWNATTEQLLFRVSNYVAADQRVWVFIDESAEFVIPASGVKSQDKIPLQRQICVSAWTDYGTLDQAPVAIVQTVGDINHSLSSVMFNPLHADEPAEITFTIVAHMDLSPGDNVSIFLSGFTAHFEHKADPARFCIAVLGAACNATFDSNSSELLMTICNFVPAGLPAVVTVPILAGIRLPLPFLGSAMDDETSSNVSELLRTKELRNIYFAVEARDGSISKSPPMSLAIMPVLATLNTSSLFIGPVMECSKPEVESGQRPCIKSLTLSVSVKISLAKGDEIYLKLPGFSSYKGSSCVKDSINSITNASNATDLINRSNNSTNNTNSLEGIVDRDVFDSPSQNASKNSLFKICWSDEETETIRVLVLNSIPRETQVHIGLTSDSDNQTWIVPPSKNGILLLLDPKNFTLAIKASEALISPVSLQHVNISGGFFDGPTAEFLLSNDWKEFGLKLQFIPAQALQLGDVITWKFPNIRSRQWREEHKFDLPYKKTNIILGRGYLCVLRSDSAKTENTTTVFNASKNNTQNHSYITINRCRLYCM